MRESIVVASVKSSEADIATLVESVLRLIRQTTELQE